MLLWLMALSLTLYHVCDWVCIPMVPSIDFTNETMTQIISLKDVEDGIEELRGNAYIFGKNGRWIR